MGTRRLQPSCEGSRNRFPFEPSGFLPDSRGEFRCVLLPAHCCAQNSCVSTTKNITTKNTYEILCINMNLKSDNQFCIGIWDLCVSEVVYFHLKYSLHFESIPCAHTCFIFIKLWLHSFWEVMEMTKARKSGRLKWPYHTMSVVITSLFRISRPILTLFGNGSIMMTSSNGNIFRVTGHLCGEFTGPRWIPRTKASDTELWCFLWSASE